MFNQIHSAVGRLITVDGTPVITTEVGNSGFALFGPYVELPAGAYCIIFQIAADSASTDWEQCGFVDVCRDAGTQVLSRKAFSPAGLAEAGGQMSIRFSTETPGCFEFRVFVNGRSALTIHQDRTLTREEEHILQPGGDPTHRRRVIAAGRGGLSRLPPALPASFTGPDGTSLIAVEPGDPGYVLHGPFVDLPASTYSVTFQIAIDQPGFTASDDEECGFVDVCADYGTRVLAAQRFSPAALARTDGRITIEFRAETAGCFEFRVFSDGRARMTIQQHRALCMEEDRGRAFATEPLRLSDETDDQLAYNAFFVNSISDFKELSAKGALVTPTAEGALVSLFGVAMHVDNPEMFQLIDEIFVRNEYNFHTTDPVCVIDIGMNTGLASLYFASLPYVAEVHAFEPFKPPFDRALKNFSLNKNIAQKIRAYNFGLSNAASDSSVLYNEAQTIGASTRGVEHGAPLTISTRDAAEVFSDIIADAKQKNLKIVVKMDCEGSEFPIFESLETADILSEASIYLIEWHKWWSPDKTQADLIAPLLTNNFIVLDKSNVFDRYAGQLAAVKIRP